MPVPSEFAGHAQYDEALEAYSLYCAVTSTSANRQVIKVLHQERAYELALWQPFVPTSSGLGVGVLSAARATAGALEAKDAENDAVLPQHLSLPEPECFGMPQKAASGMLVFDGRVYCEWDASKHKLGWMDPMLEEVLNRNAGRRTYVALVTLRLGASAGLSATL